jgi:hypothetical protein
MKQYETKWLFTDAEADVTICSYKQTSFMASMIGSMIVNLFVNFVTNLNDPLFKRDLPFLTEYTGSTIFLNTVN